MPRLSSILSVQEKRIENGEEQILTSAEARSKRGRIDRMLMGIRKKPPRIAVERARLMTESFRQTEGTPMVLRWALALENVLKNIEITIGEDDLIVGRCGPPGRYGILYPELRGAWLETGLESFPTRKEGRFFISDEDTRIVKEELIPYWKGRTVFETNFNLLPEETRHVLYQKDDPYTPSYAIIDSTTDRSSQQWVPDYNKVLTLGFNGIRATAEKKIKALSL